MKPSFVIAASVGLAVVSVALGASLVHFDTRPYQMAQSFHSRVENWLGEEDPIPPTTFESTFVNLDAVSRPLDLSRQLSGGGLTRLEDGVLVLAADGTFFYATSPENIQKLSIAAPPNGFEAYKEDAEGRFSNLEHRFYWFRYNDILAIKEDETLSLIASFTRYHPERACYGTALARLDISDEDFANVSADASAWKTLYETEPCLPLKETFRAIEGHTAGGRIAYDGNEHIYLGSGDYHLDGLYSDVSVAQNDDYDHGKVIKIALDGSGHSTFSKGLRNMQGVAWFNGALWTVEHGMRGGDELNLITEGRNYGWPQVTFGTQYNLKPMPGTEDSIGRHDGFEKPVFAWLPSVAISSLNAMNDVHPAWNGDLLMASLAGQSLFRIRIEDDRVLFAERIPVGMRVRYAQPVEGGAVLLSDDNNLVFLEARDIYEHDPIGDTIAQMGLNEADVDALQQVIQSCIECHSVALGDHTNAPSLAGLSGRSIGATPFDGYSEALGKKSGTWTKDSLQSYLDDPQAFAPGTIMPDPGIDNPETLERLSELISLLPNS